jgi:hypothetical protein
MTNDAAQVPVRESTGKIVVVGGSVAERRTVSFSGPHPTVVLLFQDSCPACRVNKASWERLVPTIASHATIPALTGEPNTATLFRTSSVDVGVVESANALHEAFPLRYVPTTPVIEKDRRVSYSHLGVLSDIDVDSIATSVRKLASGGY